MTYHKIDTVDDAILVTQLYRIDVWPFEEGTALGFANWLYIRTLSVSTEELRSQVDEYRLQVETSRNEGRDLDASVQIDADGAMQGHRFGEKAVNDLMWAIRRVKSDEFGRSIWCSIAELATSSDVADVVRRTDVTVIAHVLPALREVAKLERAVSVPYPHYVPGEDDSFVQMAIERMDHTLQSHCIWRDGEQDWPIEVRALMKLASNPQALEKAILGEACGAVVH